MKGIAPIVATILMLLIVVAIVGFVYTFFSGMAGTTAEETETQLRATISAMSKGIWIDSASGTTLIVRNLGTESISLATGAEEITVSGYTCDWGTATEIGAGLAAVCTLGATCPAGSTITVMGPSNTLSKTCS